MRNMVMWTALALIWVAGAYARPVWLPAHYSIPSDTLSPNGRYGVMVPDFSEGGPSKLVDIKTGRIVAELIGAYGWQGTNPSMEWGNMAAAWSADGTLLSWIYPDKWFTRTDVLVKLHNGAVVWQVELMKPAQRAILARTEAAAPLNFAAAKLQNSGGGSAYPEGFSIDISGTGPMRFPIAYDVSLTSNPKSMDDDDPDSPVIRASMTMTVAADGSFSFSNFSVKPGNFSPVAIDEVKSDKATFPLIDTALGKALLIPGATTKDARYAMAWTVLPASQGIKPVDWSHWDPTNPDKLLRQYDWQSYGGEAPGQYKPVDFILDLHSRAVAELPTDAPYWPGKRDGWIMSATWCSGPDGSRYCLVENDQEEYTQNFWLVTLGATMKVKELTAAMRNPINAILHERRPEIANLNDFLVLYPLNGGGEIDKPETVANVPFSAQASVSDQTEFGISGTVSIQLSTGAVLGAASDAKRLNPFVDNSALRAADAKLNLLYHALLKSMSGQNAASFKQSERDWVRQRDADADQAVNIMQYGSAPEACEQAREQSLLQSTEKRIEDLDLGTTKH